MPLCLCAARARLGVGMRLHASYLAVQGVLDWILYWTGLWFHFCNLLGETLGDGEVLPGLDSGF
jgi:hypothetical protein